MKKILFLIISMALSKTIISMERNSLLAIPSDNVNMHKSYMIGIPVTAPVDTICKHFFLMSQMPDKQDAAHYEGHYIHLVNFTMAHEMLPDTKKMLTKYTEEFESFTINMAPKVVRENNELYWYSDAKKLGSFLLKKITLELSYRLQNLKNLTSNIPDESNDTRLLSQSFNGHSSPILKDMEYSSTGNKCEEPHILFNEIQGESYTTLCNYLANDTFSLEFPATCLILFKINEKTNHKTVINIFPFQVRQIPLETTIFHLWNTFQSMLKRKD
jgi:hypothetical protein